MKKIVPVILLFGVLFLNSFSQDIDNENLLITHGPYLQNLTSTGVTIVWTTNKPSVPGINLTSPDGKKIFIRNSHDGMVDAGGLVQKVRIDDLEPETTYKYSLNSVQILKYQAYKIYYGDTLTRKAESFTTPSLKSDKVVFTVINDVHENSGKFASYLKKGNVKGQEFYIFDGDMVDYLQNTDQLYKGFIDTAVTYFASAKPFYYIRGNHETRGYEARDLKNSFDYKDNSFYYSFDNGPVHFVILDCGEDKPDNNRYYYGMADYDSYRITELEWLKKEVKSDAFRNAKQRIVIIHMPVLKEEKQNYGMKFLSDNFGPVLKGANIDLMISGHTHRNAYYEAGKTGFDYPLLVNSNNSFVEVEADLQGITATVKDPGGKIINTYTIK
jgi:UDP-2,3-diacylglucosamine pyrophosphatase LpxH